jgi:hypothetical protein
MRSAFIIRPARDRIIEFRLNFSPSNNPFSLKGGHSAKNMSRHSKCIQHLKQRHKLSLKCHELTQGQHHSSEEAVEGLRMDAHRRSGQFEAGHQGVDNPGVVARLDTGVDPLKLAQKDLLVRSPA